MICKQLRLLQTLTIPALLLEFYKWLDGLAFFTCAARLATSNTIRVTMIAGVFFI